MSAAELASVPSAVGDAVARATSETSGHHLGFDTNIYPGDRAMAAWKRSGEYEWVGYYLPAPCHKDTSWSGTRARLTRNGWGLAVIYVGQQTWGRSLTQKTSAKSSSTKSKKSRSKRSRSTRTMTRRTTAPVATSGDRCSASFVHEAQGVIDARDAMARTAREGFPDGTVVFLDVEYMDVLPALMREYYKAWTRTVLADGRYRPGIYAHTRNAAKIYDDVSDMYEAAGIDAEPPFWIAGAGRFSPERPPTDVGHSFASVWQGMLDVVRTHNGVRLPIDISVAAVPSPSLMVE